MKKYAALLLLFCAGFSLSAQTYREATIYLTPVTGTGSGPGDNDYISDLIIEHLENLNYLPVRSLRNAAFTLFTSIAPRDTSEDESSENDVAPIYQSQTYVLNLQLMDNRTSKIVVTQTMFYSETEEIDNLLILNFNLIPFASEYFEPKLLPPPEPVIEKDPDEWRKKQWYLSAGIFWTPRVYAGDHESTYYVNFGYGLFAEYHFLKFAEGKLKFLEYLSLGAGLELVPDWVAVRENESYRDLLLEIPLLVNGVLKPSSYFMLVPYTGINFNIALYRDTAPPPVAWRLGFQYGIKAGPGILVIDPWFSMDIGQSSLDSNPDIKYQRYMMHIGVKYKYGFDDFKNFLWFKQ
jgi:hypothetical protein